MPRGLECGGALLRTRFRVSGKLSGGVEGWGEGESGVAIVADSGDSGDWRAKSGWRGIPADWLWAPETTDVVEEIPSLGKIMLLRARESKVWELLFPGAVAIG